MDWMLLVLGIVNAILFIVGFTCKKKQWWIIIINGCAAIVCLIVAFATK